MGLLFIIALWAIMLSLIFYPIFPTFFNRKNKEVKSSAEPDSTSPFTSINPFLISIGYFLFSVFIVYYVTSNTYTEIGVPEFQGSATIYCISLPAFLIYYIYMAKFLNFAKFLRVFTYPLFSINILLSFISIGTFLTFIFTSLILIVLSIPVLLIIGLVRDIKYFSENKKNKQL